MGDVKRYTRPWEWNVDCLSGSHNLVESPDGEYVLHSDYARLDRERDHYKAFHDETMPVLEAAQGLRNRLEATERAMATQAEELTRLRAVEAAALALLEKHEACWPTVFPKQVAALAEACGRKG